MPVAVLEKGKQPGSHLLSGAVVNPVSLRRLFEGRLSTSDMPFAGRVEHESVYYLTPKRALRIPTPPTMHNSGNYVASLSQFGRWLAEQAEEAGATILPETTGHALLVDGRVRGVRTGDRGRGRAGEELGNFEPGSDVHARVTVLAEGTQGHLTGVALDHFGLQGDNPQVWALGVKEVWKVAKPLDRVIHTMGWPLRGGKKYREFGGSFVYPIGDDMVTVGMVVGLDYRDAELSVHDLLQELKTHPLLRKLLDGGERVAWGAKTIPEGGFVSLPRQLHAPGILICGDGAGLVNVPALKGIHYAVESGRLAAEAAFAALQPGEAVGRRGALAGYDEALRESFVWSDLKQVRNMRQAFGRGFWLGGAMAGAMTASRGALPAGRRGDGARRRPGADPHRPREELPGGGRQAHVRQALVRLPLREQDPRRRAEPHPRTRPRSARARRALDAHVPGRGVRGRRGGGRRRRPRRGHTVELRPVRRDHGERRPPDATRGRLRPGVHAHVAAVTLRSPCLHRGGAAIARTHAGWGRFVTLLSPCLTPGSSWRTSRQRARRSRGGSTGRRRSPPRRSVRGPARNVYLKAELFQKTGSFKPRGVLTNLAAAHPGGAGTRRDRHLRRQPRPGARLGRGHRGARRAARDVARRERGEDRGDAGLRRGSRPRVVRPHGGLRAAR